MVEYMRFRRSVTAWICPKWIIILVELEAQRCSFDAECSRARACVSVCTTIFSSVNYFALATSYYDHIISWTLMRPNKKTNIFIFHWIVISFIHLTTHISSRFYNVCYSHTHTRTLTTFFSSPVLFRRDWNGTKKNQIKHKKEREKKIVKQQYRPPLFTHSHRIIPFRQL